MFLSTSGSLTLPLTLSAIVAGFTATSPPQPFLAFAASCASAVGLCDTLLFLYTRKRLLLGRKKNGQPSKIHISSQKVRPPLVLYRKEGFAIKQSDPSTAARSRASSRFLSILYLTELSTRPSRICTSSRRTVLMTTWCRTSRRRILLIFTNRRSTTRWAVRDCNGVSRFLMMNG